MRLQARGRGPRAAAPALVALLLVAAAAAPALVSPHGTGSADSARGLGVAARAKWDFGRFSKTVSFFRGSPWKLLLPAFLQSEDKKARPQWGAEPEHDGAEVTIVDWGESDGMPVGETWGQLDDVVMGGVSSSRLTVEGTGAGRRLAFEGRTSRENNGGFCSFRSRIFSPPLNLSSYEGLAFTARCRDGLRYKIQLRDNTGWDSVGYAAGFDVPADGKEVEIRIPFSQLKANFRSRTDPSAPPIQSSSIYSVQFVLSAFEFDKAMNPRFKEGDFRLELGSLRAYRRES